ncbi:MAG: prolipoprotein diacylglyceryl transferase [Acidobacteriota bacterium]
MPYVHDIDPVLADLGGIYLWWYGLGFSLGFLQIHLYLRRHRLSLHLTEREVYRLTLLVIAGVLAGGRAVEVSFDEWSFYRDHAWLIPAYWLGGMATHGLLIGAAAGTALFAWRWRKSFLTLADALVIPGAVLMGLGRVGNFIDGQIVGGLTNVAWGVQFPDADGFRHPVVLYDGLKNFVLAAFLVLIRLRNPTPGAVAARFVFWYAFPRVFIDLLRDYPTHRLALGTGQTLNLAMSLIGLALLYRSRLRRLGRLGRSPSSSWSPAVEAPLKWQQVALVALLLACLTIPSNWTQNVPERYGARHAGLRHSVLYPDIDTTPRGSGRP